LDDIDRAEAHGDLNGAFKAVADQLAAVLQKLGLESFGAEGDAFDPGIHEAVMHDERADIAVPTTTTVMRRGYRVGDRLLRPAMVGVSDPATAGSDDEASDPDDELS
jgi:molecular chaperone GrpE